MERLNKRLNECVHSPDYGCEKSLISLKTGHFNSSGQSNLWRQKNILLLKSIHTHQRNMQTSYMQALGIMLSWGGMCFNPFHHKTKIYPPAFKSLFCVFYLAEAECGWISECQWHPSVWLWLLINHTDESKALLSEGHCAFSDTFTDGFRRLPKVSIGVILIEAFAIYPVIAMLPSEPWCNEERV